MTTPPGSEVTWFQYDQETGKVKNGIPIVLRNAGPDAYATAQATIQAQGASASTPPRRNASR